MVSRASVSYRWLRLLCLGVGAGIVLVLSLACPVGQVTVSNPGGADAGVPGSDGGTSAEMALEIGDGVYTQVLVAAQKMFYFPRTRTTLEPPYSVWEGVKPKTEAYERLKEERSQVLWRALERVIPDVRQRAEVVLDTAAQGVRHWYAAGGVGEQRGELLELHQGHDHRRQLVAESRLADNGQRPAAGGRR